MDGLAAALERSQLIWGAPAEETKELLIQNKELEVEVSRAGITPARYPARDPVRSEPSARNQGRKPGTKVWVPDAPRLAAADRPERVRGRGRRNGVQYLDEESVVSADYSEMYEPDSEWDMESEESLAWTDYSGQLVQAPR